MTIAGDSNDIYILSGEQHSDQLSTPPSLFCAEDNGSGPGSWQTESLPASLAGHESWAHIAMTDPEDAKSLDSNEGAALAEERSDNNSSNSDIVHVEREEAELLEEAAAAAAGGGGGAAIEEPGLQESMMSVLGTESDLAELRAQFREQSPPPPESFLVESSSASVTLEEPVLLEAPEISLTLPSLASPEPEPPHHAHDAAETAAPRVGSEPTPLAVIAIEPDPEPEVLRAAGPAAPPSPRMEAPAPASVEPTPEPAPEAERDEVPLQAEEPQPGVQIVEDPEIAAPVAAPLSPVVPEAPVEAPVEAPPMKPVEQLEPEPEPKSDSEFPVLLFGGAVVALAAVAAYGALAYRRK